MNLGISYFVFRISSASDRENNENQLREGAEKLWV